jgi:hypothetical protein
MAINYKQLSTNILNELSSKLQDLDEARASHFAKQLCAFYQFVTFQNTLPQPDQGEDDTLHLVSLGVLVNHFLKHESPQVPTFPIQRDQKE